MSRKYRLAVFIGRFQPFHLGHYSVIEQALTLADNVLVLIGSSGGPRTHRNPFTFSERSGMITQSFKNGRVACAPIQDHLYNDERWIEEVQNTVKMACLDWYKDECNPITDKDITLVGHAKDHTSYYLKLFPQWSSEDCGKVNNLDSTSIRSWYFYDPVNVDQSDVTAPTQEFLDKFSKKPEYTELKKEFDFVTVYKEMWSKAPFPPTFVTVDAVVVQSGHILLVKRGGFPGKGLWALPGGFLNPSETTLDGCIRELREETKIKVPAPVLRGNIVTSRVFDDPNRSSRGRTITHAFLIRLPPEECLPKVRGSDDAEKARWVPVSEIKRSEMFEDHFHIIENLVGIS